MLNNAEIARLLPLATLRIIPRL